MRAEIENAARCVVMIVLSMTLMVGLLPLAPGFAPAAQAAGEEEILAARGEQEVEPLAADTDEGQTAELYDTNITDANCHQLVLVVRFAAMRRAMAIPGLMLCLQAAC